MIRKCLVAIILLLLFANLSFAQEEIKESFYKSFAREIRFSPLSPDSCMIANASIDFSKNQKGDLIYTVSGDSERINKTLNEFLYSSKFNNTYILYLLTKYKEVILPIYYSVTGYGRLDCLTFESINLNERLIIRL